MNSDIETQLHTLEASLKAAQRKLAITGVITVFGVSIAFALGWHKEAIAQGYTVTLAQLATRMTAQETKTQFITTDGDTKNGGNVYITNANLCIRNGTDPVSPYANGFGNLIIGPDYGATVRTGSHVLIIGEDNDYSALCGLEVGTAHGIQGSYVSVSGGDNNHAAFQCSSVQGGQGNQALNFGCSTSGGSSRTTSGGVSRWAAGSLSQNQ